jgi:hypothetical protein
MGRPLGWAVREHLGRQLALDALEMALASLSRAGREVEQEVGPQTDAAAGVRVILVGHGAAVMAAWRAEAARIATLPEAPLDELEPAPAPNAASPEGKRRGDQGLVPRSEGKPSRRHRPAPGLPRR